MKVQPTEIAGAFLIELDIWRDERGHFAESWQAARYAAHGIDVAFVQDDVSVSAACVLRGLHYQIERPQGHLVTVVAGRIFDVGLDLRCGSPTFGKVIARMLDAEGPQQLYLPPGVAHGFCVLGDGATIHYKCTDAYHPGGEAGVVWNDPDLAIAWPLAEPLVADKDRRLPRLRDVGPDRLPRALFS